MTADEKEGSLVISAKRFGVAVLGLGLLVLTGCSAEDKAEIKRLAMPEPASVESHYIYDLWQGAWLAVMLVGVLVWGLIFWSAWRFRRRSDDDVPVQMRYHLPLEIFYTVAPVIMVVVFFQFTVEAQNEIHHAPADVAEAQAEADDSVTVIGQQWSFTFNYTDVDALGGETVHEVGTTAEPPTLWLVKDKSVSILLNSPDVIHSFWVPNFLYKLDIVPGRDNHFTVTPDREGTFVGRCAELCGVYHSRMLFNVKVTDQASFDAHMKELQEAGNVGLRRGGEHADTQAGLGDLEHHGGDQ